MRSPRRPFRLKRATDSRLPLVISLLALVVALSGVPVVPAATHAVRLALFSKNAGAVDGLKASKKPRPGRLVPLGSKARFPRSVIPAVDAPSVGGISAARVPDGRHFAPAGRERSLPRNGRATRQYDEGTPHRGSRLSHDRSAGGYQSPERPRRSV